MNEIETNKAAFLRFREAVNSRDLTEIEAAVDEIVDPDLKFHAPVPFDAAGPEVLKRVWAVLLGGLPDIHVTVDDVIAEGDKVVFRNTVTGTHTGEFRGVPPTGRSITYDEMFIVRFAAGKVAEIWGIVDTFAQMQQIGAIPGGPAPALAATGGGDPR
jgi:predicted ester cyclase